MLRIAVRGRGTVTRGRGYGKEVAEWTVSRTVKRALLEDPWLDPALRSSLSTLLSSEDFPIARNSPTSTAPDEVQAFLHDDSFSLASSSALLSARSEKQYREVAERMKGEKEKQYDFALAHNEELLETEDAMADSRPSSPSSSPSSSSAGSGSGPTLAEYKPVAFRQRRKDPLHFQAKGSVSDLFASRLVQSSLSSSSPSLSDFEVLAPFLPFDPSAHDSSLSSTRSLFDQRVAFKALDRLDSLAFDPLLQDFEAPFRSYSDYKEVMVVMLENALNQKLIEAIGGIPRPVKDTLWRHRGAVNFPFEDKRYHWSDYVTIPRGITEIECIATPLTYLQNRRVGKDYVEERMNFTDPKDEKDGRLCSVVLNFHQGAMVIVHPQKDFELSPDLTYLRIPPQWLWALKNVRWPALPLHRWTGSDLNDPSALISSSLVGSFPSRTRLNNELPPPANPFSLVNNL